MINWSNCPEVESVPGKDLASGATIYDSMEWFEGVEETDVKAVLEFVAQDLRARVPDAHTVR